MTGDHADVGALDCADLLDAVRADPHRKPFEKESRVLWSAERSVTDFCTAEPALMRRLLCHPSFTLRWFECRVANADRATKAVHRDDSDGFGSWRGTPVFCVEGSLPLGCLTVSATARKGSGHANAVVGQVLDNDPRKGGADD